MHVQRAQWVVQQVYVTVRVDWTTERKSKDQKIRLSKDQNFNEKKYDIEKHISKVLQSVSSMFQVVNSVQKALL